MQEWGADKAPPQPKAKRGSVLYRGVELASVFNLLKMRTLMCPNISRKHNSGYGTVGQPIPISEPTNSESIINLILIICPTKHFKS